MALPTDGNDQRDRPDQSEHPDLSSVAGEMRAQWREEQDSATADAVAQLRHGRGLTDWLRERMHAGDRVAVVVAARTFVGLLTEVGDDLATLRSESGLVEIHVCAAIPISFRLEEHATQGGTRGATGRTFRDALVARDGRDDVRVGTRQAPEGLDGTLLVGRDFVSIVTRALVETVVPIADVAWATPVRP
jgi:hypothetical protein